MAETATLEAPPARKPTAAAKQCSICPPILPGQSWADRCACGEARNQHEALTHPSTPCGRGVTCFGQNLAGKCRRPECGCTQFTLKQRAGK